MFALRAHRHHYTGGSSVYQYRHATKRLCRTSRFERDAQSLACAFHVGTNQQRLTCAQDVFGQPVGAFAPPPLQKLAVFHFQVECDLFSFLEGNVEVRCIKDLPEFFLDCAQYFLLVKPRTDRLADLREQLILLGPTLRVMHHDVVLKRQPDLQCEADEQAKVRGAKELALGVWK